MPKSRKAGTNVKGGGFGKTLGKQDANKSMAGMAFAKPDITRLLAFGEEVRQFELKEMLIHKNNSTVEYGDLEDFIQSALMQQRTIDEKRALVVKNNDGSLYDTNRNIVIQTRATGDRINLLKNVRPGDVPIPERPFIFREGIYRVLECAKYVCRFIKAAETEDQIMTYREWIKENFDVSEALLEEENLRRLDAMTEEERERYEEYGDLLDGDSDADSVSSGNVDSHSDSESEEREQKPVSRIMNKWWKYVPAYVTVEPSNLASFTIEEDRGTAESDCGMDSNFDRSSFGGSIGDVSDIGDIADFEEEPVAAFEESVATPTAPTPTSAGNVLDYLNSVANQDYDALRNEKADGPASIAEVMRKVAEEETPAEQKILDHVFAQNILNLNADSTNTNAKKTLYFSDILPTLKSASTDVIASALFHWFTKKENIGPFVTKALMEEEENVSFAKWRSLLHQIEEIIDPVTKKQTVITPFERNLDYWRQLWRTVERSDIVVQILDARNPNLFLNLELVKLVKKLPNKFPVICLNKVDYLSSEQRKIWLDYILETAGTEDIKVICYSSLRELMRGELGEDGEETEFGKLTLGVLNTLNQQTDCDQDDDMTPTGLTDFLNEKLNEKSNVITFPNGKPLPWGQKPSKKQRVDEDAKFTSATKKRAGKGKKQRFADSETESDSGDIVDLTEMMGGKKARVSRKEMIKELKEENNEKDRSMLHVSLQGTQDWEGVLDTASLQHELDVIGDSILLAKQRHRKLALDVYGLMKTHMVSSTENMNMHQDILQSVIIHAIASCNVDHPVAPIKRIRDHSKAMDNILTSYFGSPKSLELFDEDVEKFTVGTIGFPNVGKSSFVNSLLRGAARVAVSRTPGKTRHLQTHEVPETRMILCDCPGLVLPTTAVSREDLVLNGVMNADTYRGSMVEPMRNLFIRVGRQYLELYGLDDIWNPDEVMPLISQQSRANGRDYFREILSDFATSRGMYQGGKGANAAVEDFARMIIKDFIDGRVIFYCEAPPTADMDHWLSTEIKKWDAWKCIADKKFKKVTDLERGLNRGKDKHVNGGKVAQIRHTH